MDPVTGPPMAAETLVDVTRADQLESWHVGSLILANADGASIAALGDAQMHVFPRSAVKILQAVPLVETGAADHFAFTPGELALACASHSGTPFHVDHVAALLERIGPGTQALRCGGHPPLDTAARRDLIRAGTAPASVHNNCSGKHAGMIATARCAGDPVEGYQCADHAVQLRIRAVMAEVTETDLSDARPGLDGCSVPNWPVPLDRLAIAFARIVSGTGLPEARGATFERLLAACWRHPEAMSGPGRFDAGMLQRFAGEVFVKSGAEGVYCGGVRSRGIGFALKIHDGAQRAAEVVVRAIVARLVGGARDLGEPIVLRNAAGTIVGDLRASGKLTAMLDRV